MSKRLQVVRDGCVILKGRRYRLDAVAARHGLKRVVVDNDGALEYDNPFIGIKADRLSIHNPQGHWIGHAEPEPRITSETKRRLAAEQDEDFHARGLDAERRAGESETFK